MKKITRVQAGISMLEILVTTFIVMVGLLVVMTSFIAIAKSGRYSERVDVANNLAKLEIERIRNLPFASIQSETGAYSEYPNHPDFRHDVSVTDLGRTREVVVRIFFENDRRRTEVRTYVANL
jgi:Tfp pilus assembly protein PilV